MIDKKHPVKNPVYQVETLDFKVFELLIRKNIRIIPVDIVKLVTLFVFL